MPATGPQDVDAATHLHSRIILHVWRQMLTSYEGETHPEIHAKPTKKRHQPRKHILSSGVVQSLFRIHFFTSPYLLEIASTYEDGWMYDYVVQSIGLFFDHPKPASQI